MAKWESTPFESIEQVRTFLERMGAKIMDEPDRPGFVTFATLSDVYERVIIAQRVEGGPVMQYVHPIKKLRFEDRYEVGPWVGCDHDRDPKTFDEVLEHCERVHLAGDEPTMVKCTTMYLTHRDGSGDVTEYRMAIGLQVRVLEMKSRRFARERREGAGSGREG